MANYLATILGIVLALSFIGRRLGRHWRGRNGKLSPLTAGILTGLGLLWFVAARLARNQADTDNAVAVPAEWFAHSGKWLVLLGGMMLGHGWICGAGQAPAGHSRRIVYYVAVLGMVALVVLRTMPVYFLLDAGRRDENGFVRQSEKYEFTCGAVALLNYLEHYRHHSPLTEREVSRVCGVTAEGTSLSALVNAARQFGLTNATARVLTQAELAQARLPVIVFISTLPTVHHATLLVRLDEKEADFIDPAYGAWKIPRERFRQIWYGQTVRFE